MITAKNYAAQCCKSLSSKESYKFLQPEEYSYVNIVGDLINRSIHFVLPDGGKLLNSRGKSFSGTDNVILPYESITIEFYDDVMEEKVLLFCTDLGDNTGEIFMQEFYSDRGGKIWFPRTRFQVIDKSCVNADGWIEIKKNIIKIKSMMLIDSAADNEDNGLISSITLLELLEALSCKNVSMVNYQEASIANAKRIKAGKLPIYETKILVLKTPQTVSKGQPGGGAHASPRQHLRRGHIRRLPFGNIWVNSCVVGDPAKGRIEKSYQVKNAS